jgi:predicted DNA-binding transcriptional regulator YafY
MSRSQRLLELLEILRQHRYPVAGQVLADQLGVSLRTLYRDIATLQSYGATIEGESGMGYVLQPGFLLPPLMFNEEEIEALVLGARWVMKRADAELSKAAHRALTKIQDVLPEGLKQSMEKSGLLVGPGEVVATDEEMLVDIRSAIRGESKLEIEYLDLKGRVSTRTIWPFAMAFFDQVRLVVAWCELREDFRNFRIDRIQALRHLNKKYPRRRDSLLREWRKIEGVSQHP